MGHRRTGRLLRGFRSVALIRGAITRCREAFVRKEMLNSRGRFLQKPKRGQRKPSGFTLKRVSNLSIATISGCWLVPRLSDYKPASEYEVQEQSGWVVH
jgi:hypothetical protein